MPAITEFPCEIINSILRYLEDVAPAILTCRYFYESFREYQVAIVRRKITPALIPYSVAVVEAPWRRYPSAEDLACSSFDAEDHTSRLTARLHTMPMYLVRRMAHTHDMIHDLVAIFAANAWTDITKKLGINCSYNTSKILIISPAEYFRFCRAFYRLELFHLLWYNRSDLLSEDTYLWFSSECSPWEMEQVVSVYEFLDEKLSKVSHDVTAHDIEFGKREIDYLSPARDNHWRQLWLSQGLRFIYRLRVMSYDSKRSLLRLHWGARAANLSYYINLRLSKYSIDTLDAAGACSKDQLRSFMSWRDYDDTDNGPFEAWYASHMPAGEWAMMAEKAWHRRHAYVFWDWDRIQNNDLLPWFKSGSEPPSPPYTPEAYDDMQASFHERTAFAKRGFSGYWRKGDYSRLKFQPF